MSEFIFTKHALERLKQRSISQDRAETVLRHPDYTLPGNKPNTVKFVRHVDGRNIQLIATHLANEKKWLVVSAWVRGENDRESLVWRILVLPFKVLWWLLKKLVTFARTAANI